MESKLEQLSVQLEGRALLNDISLTIPSGQSCAVIGPSGAGKSTLIKTMLGVPPANAEVSGECLFDGSPFPDRKKQAYVPQNPGQGLDPLKTLLMQWRQAERAAGVPVNELKMGRILSSLSLPHPGGSYPHQWSRGMLQRYLVALALLRDPSLIVLDEPTSALDLINAADVMAVVDRYCQKSGCTLVIVTHDLALACRHCRQFAVIDSGQLADNGSYQEVVSNGHPVTKALFISQYWEVEHA